MFDRDAKVTADSFTFLSLQPAPKPPSDALKHGVPRAPLSAVVTHTHATMRPVTRRGQQQHQQHDNAPSFSRPQHAAAQQQHASSSHFLNTVHSDSASAAVSLSDLDFSAGSSSNNSLYAGMYCCVHMQRQHLHRDLNLQVKRTTQQQHHSSNMLCWRVVHQVQHHLACCNILQASQLMCLQQHQLQLQTTASATAAATTTAALSRCLGQTFRSCTLLTASDHPCCTLRAA